MTEKEKTYCKKNFLKNLNRRLGKWEKECQKRGEVVDDPAIEGMFQSFYEERTINDSLSEEIKEMFKEIHGPYNIGCRRKVTSFDYEQSRRYNGSWENGIKILEGD
ncbi:hypothetical protein KKC91_05180 [bacterium]|nr:hypothetical protein [bacterium]